MKLRKFAAAALALALLTHACALAREAGAAASGDALTCVVTELSSGESICIEDPALVARVMDDVFSGLDFDALDWQAFIDSSVPAPEGCRYSVHFLRNSTPWDTDGELMIALGEDVMAVNGAPVDADPVALYLLDGLFAGLQAQGEPGFIPLQ